MNLKKIITAKNSGFRIKEFQVAEWNTTICVREPLHIDFYRYVKSIEKTSKDDSLTEQEKDLLNIKAETLLFAATVIDKNGNLIFNSNDSKEMEALVESYGPVHTRVLNKALELIELNNDPLKEAEKK